MNTGVETVRLAQMYFCASNSRADGLGVFTDVDHVIELQTAVRLRLSDWTGSRPQGCTYSLNIRRRE
ncbi:hypothetical protein ACFVYG_08760 [Streptomyces sp. NPDC058256]|uniref:hypothetical protein n=1 Tax=Streptomyces sp. NPDC058256 TaxID=3346408 RepID=UPI0036E252C0